ncbi:hypothetical protein ACIQ9J_01630 [Streptomyces sp. NPDC094153]|uniref:hypothetical protein n=1 Tax=Streptomyces sp. NPDC094153 TaxID=3366058 RepID=UPI00382E28FA
MIFHDAADTFTTLITAALLWAGALGAAAGFVLAVVFLALGPLVAPTAKTTARHLSRPSWASGPFRARILARTHTMRPSARPAWAHTQPLDYQEAA